MQQAREMRTELVCTLKSQRLLHGKKFKLCKNICIKYAKNEEFINNKQKTENKINGSHCNKKLLVQSVY